MHLGMAPSTSISWAHSSGMSEIPSFLAAAAGNSAVRSGVAVNTRLTRSCFSIPLRTIICSRSRDVAATIEPASLSSVVMAPRTALIRFSCTVLESHLLVELCHLRTGEVSIFTRLQPLHT